MKFNPGTKQLFTDSGELVKVLRCPLPIRWEQLTATAGEPHRSCARCERQVLDTAVMSEEEVVAAVRADPSTCLCVRSGQPNLTLIAPPARRGSIPDAPTDPDNPRGAPKCL